MKRLAALLMVGLAAAILAGSADAGAKDGKMRWTRIGSRRGQ